MTPAYDTNLAFWFRIGAGKHCCIKKAPTAFLLKDWMALYPLESQKTLMELEGLEVAVVAEHPGQPQL